LNVNDLIRNGIALKNAGRLAEAESCYRQALRVDPACTEAIGNLGIVLRLQKRPAEAIECFRRLIAGHPGLAQAHYSLGNALSDTGDHSGALAAFRKAIEIEPGHFESRVNMGLAQWASGDPDAAADTLAEATRRHPGFAPAWRSLGMVEEKRGRLPESIAAYRQAIGRDDQDVTAHLCLGALLRDLGEAETALAHYAQALRLRPDEPSIHDAYLLCLTYAGVDETNWFAAHRAYGERFSSRAGGPVATDANPDRRLRIGYLSGDFSQHAVANFIWPVIRAHDRERFEIVCYYNGPTEDRATALFSGIADRWRHISGLGTDELVARIQADAIDILIDLSAHSAHNRLDVFARRAAPVQMTWMGYAASTGLRTIDWRITDATLDPPGNSEAFHSEGLARIEFPYSLCFEPSPVCPDPAPPPVMRAGRITFASFNNSAKLNRKTTALWARVLEAVPGSRLLLYMRGSADARIAAHARGLFARHGVDPARIEPFDRQSFIDYLRRHDQADIALDPVGFSGVTTSCYSLWMGVATLTLPQRLPITRGTMAIERLLGLDAWIADNEEDYVARAARLAADPESLAGLRATLRERMRSSPLMDARAFTRALEALYRSHWRKTVCASPGGS
jgi:protein O-GlcNAc transferase